MRTGATFYFNIMRINKYIASCGVASRREADKLIEQGRVLVNGAVPTTGMDVTDEDTVLLDGKEISLKENFTYLAYYKPVGVVCTTKDAHAERTVIEDLNFPERVTYAGRLDKDSEGLIIMTDDGELIEAMMKSSKNHEKEYEVTVDKDISGDFLKKMSNGVYLPELDRTTRPCVVTRTGKRSFNIILTQGLNRQIRRMCAELCVKVVKLKRIRVMSVKLSDYKLLPGKYVVLDEKAVKRLLGECNIKR